MERRRTKRLAVRLTRRPRGYFCRHPADDLLRSIPRSSALARNADESALTNAPSNCIGSGVTPMNGQSQFDEPVNIGLWAIGGMTIQS